MHLFVRLGSGTWGSGLNYIFFSNMYETNSFHFNPLPYEELQNGQIYIALDFLLLNKLITSPIVFWENLTFSYRQNIWFCFWGLMLTKKATFWRFLVEVSLGNQSQLYSNCSFWYCWGTSNSKRLLWCYILSSSLLLSTKEHSYRI